MKSIKLTAIREMEIWDVPTPKIRNTDDVLIKMKRVGVCGSDVHYYENGKIGSQVIKYPFTVGHEGAGVVAAIGDGVTTVIPGDRIAIDPAMPCHICDQCLTGRSHTCRKLRYLGCPDQAEGCLSEYIVMPEKSCFKIYNNISLDEASLSEPLSIGVYAVQQSIPLKDKNIGILGSGPIGMSVLLPARAQGANNIYATDKIDKRLQLALKSGATWSGNPDKTDIISEINDLEPSQLDVVFECCGKQEALDQAVEILKPGGKLMLIGIPPTADRVTFLIDKLRHKEICIQNVRRQNNCLQDTLDMIENKVFDVSTMITHRYEFKNTQAAFELVSKYEDGVLKAMIDFE